jgi:uncharacterized repeat protein (TIGR01451 family)
MHAKDVVRSALAIAAGLLAMSCSSVPPTPQLTTTPSAPPTLLLAKLVDKEQAMVGDLVTYTLVLMNDQLGAEDPGAKVQLLDELPETLELQAGSLSSGATYDEVTRTVRWSGRVPQGGSVDITFRAVLTPAAAEVRSVLNTAVVTDALGQVTERSAQVQVVH